MVRNSQKPIPRMVERDSSSHAIGMDCYEKVGFVRNRESLLVCFRSRRVDAWRAHWDLRRSCANSRLDRMLETPRLSKNNAVARTEYASVASVKCRHQCTMPAPAMLLLPRVQ